MIGGKLLEMSNINICKMAFNSFNSFFQILVFIEISYRFTTYVSPYGAVG
jgi:hypothetical protein